MRVKLTQDVLEFKADPNIDGSQDGPVKTTVRFSRGTAMQWRKGATIDMSDASAEKFINRGLAERIKPETAGQE
jgi:hypothetical protein